MIRSRLWIVVVCAVGIVGGAACSDSGFKLVPASGNPQQNVMVIDTGIDLSAADLQGRVSAVYTETCVDNSGPASDAGSMPAVDGGPVFDAMKQALLMAFAQPDDSCDLKPGIGGKTDPMPTIAKFKLRWNAMVRANQLPSQVFNADEISQLMAPIDNEMHTFAYHGTATSTTVSHENPQARLVLVERQLASEGALMTGFTCFAQSDINQAVDLLSDPQVYAAAVAQPAQIDSQIAQAQTTYKVGIVNESFGAESRQTLESLQLSAKCPQPIDLSAYFALIDKMTNAHNATIAGPPILTVQAAGNDGVEIDTGADSLSCDLGDPKDLLVGSYDPLTLARNTFSNYGACVNVYAPGQDIVVEYAGGWLLFPDGTSFSSPLTARYASMATSVPSPFDPAGARTAVLSVIGQQNQFLPVNLFPQDFFYTPEQATTDFVVPLAALPASRPVHVALTQHELHRVLGPLNRVRRLLHGW